MHVPDLKTQVRRAPLQNNADTGWCAAAPDVAKAVTTEEAMAEREVSRFGLPEGVDEDSTHPISSRRLHNSLKNAAKVNSPACS